VGQVTSAKPPPVGVGVQNVPYTWTPSSGLVLTLPGIHDTSCSCAASLLASSARSAPWPRTRFEARVDQSKRISTPLPLETKAGPTGVGAEAEPMPSWML